MDISRKKIRTEVVEEFKEIGEEISDEKIDKITERRLLQEIRKGVQ